MVRGCILEALAQICCEMLLLSVIVGWHECVFHMKVNTKVDAIFRSVCAFLPVLVKLTFSEQCILWM